MNGHANPNALYLIDSGGNDAITAAIVFGANAALANPYLLGEARILANAVATLQAKGARYIVVANQYVPPFPFFNSPPVSGYWNTISTATWADLASAGVRFIPADTRSVIAAVEQNPLAFGITAPITSNACVLSPWLAASLSTIGLGQAGYGAVCAPTTTPSNTYGYLVSADALQTHLFLDGLHLTEAGQIIIADYYYSLIAAPGEISFLAESAVQTTFQMINDIQQQIDCRGVARPDGIPGSMVRSPISR